MKIIMVMMLRSRLNRAGHWQWKNLVVSYTENQQRRADNQEPTATTTDSDDIQSMLDNPHMTTNNKQLVPTDTTDNQNQPTMLLHNVNNIR